MDWKQATAEQIAAMSFRDTKEIVQRQIALGYSKDTAWCPRAHLTRALEIILGYAEMYNAKIQKVSDDEK